MAHIIDRKSKLIEIFDDTLDFINEEPDLFDKVEYSKRETEMIPEDEFYDLDKPSHKGKIVVTKSRTLEAAVRYAQDEQYLNKNIAVLNFASATSPGGGVKNGSSAQEECLCRCSTLFPVLNQTRLQSEFYGPHYRNKNPLNNDDIIYSPDIVIVKTDEEFPQRLEPEDWCLVDVITCAAPNLRPRPTNKYNPSNGDKAIKISDEELYQLHLTRAEHILNVAAGNDIDVLILGAFGCGAFMNDPIIVAKAFNTALQQYAKYFDVVEFAVFTNAFETKNFAAFNEVFSE